MNGGFRSLHPAALFLYYMCAVLFGMLLSHPVFLMTEICLLTGLIIMQKQGRALLRMLLYMLPIGGAIAVINPLVSHRGRHILFYLMDQPITLEALLFGITTMLSITVVLLASLSYNHNVTADKFMYLFGRLAPKTALVALMAMRFVPLLRLRLSQIAIVQQTRGISMKEGPLRKRIKNGTVLMKVLLVWSLEEAVETADAMKARGYGTARRTAYSVYRMDRRDHISLLYLAAGAAIVITGGVLDYGTLTIYPRMESLMPGIGDIILYLLFVSFLATPLILEGKEHLSWKLSGRKDYPSTTPMKSGPPYRM
ncbi:energy-coupling factor transporter transmembrane component T [Paenibacillus terreus]|uniref:energy-coupling factor transporter transmembrane component T n=1 Tax=Paenibacillus terreus TaxID=1387834 RepID=UPI0035CCFA4F